MCSVICFVLHCVSSFDCVFLIIGADLDDDDDISTPIPLRQIIGANLDANPPCVSHHWSHLNAKCVFHIIGANLDDVILTV